ncbi:MAG TPA: hypothetical protein VFI22_08960 [Thermomicrobiales bacterium]|nr:hypothetical protein [Thermomicrobiales bacterium]
MSDPDEERGDLPPDEPAPSNRPPSVTIGSGTALAVGCIIVIIVLIAAALIFVPRPHL